MKVAFDSPATARRGTLPFSRDDDTGRGGSLRALLTPTRHLTLHGHRTAARTHSGHRLTIRHVRIRFCARARHRRCDCPKTAGSLSRSHDHARRHEALPRPQDDSFDTRRRRATTMGPAAGSALSSLHGPSSLCQGSAWSDFIVITSVADPTTSLPKQQGANCGERALIVEAVPRERKDAWCQWRQLVAKGPGRLSMLVRNGRTWSKMKN